VRFCAFFFSFLFFSLFFSRIIVTELTRRYSDWQDDAAPSSRWGVSAVPEEGHVSAAQAV
jgi:hypothetical protein